MQLLPLTREHNCGNFRSAVDGVDRYLHNEALKANESREARTMAWAIDDDVVGYFTLRVAVLDPVAGGPRFSSPKAPGFLLAKLGLTENYQGKDHGPQLLAKAVAMAADAGDLVGGRFLVVDASDGAHGFYRRFDFTPFTDGSMRLYMPMARASSIRDQLRAS